MTRISVSAHALAAAMNAELYRRGVPAFVRVEAVVPAPAGEGVEGGDWAFSLERSLVGLHNDHVASRYAEALFSQEAQVQEVARWAAERFAVEWEAAPRREPIVIPAPEPVPRAPAPAGTVVAEKAAGGE